MKINRQTRVKIGRIHRAIRETVITIHNYWEFSMAVLGYGVWGIYAIYVFSRAPIYMVELNTCSPHYIAGLIVSGDLVELFYYSTPGFEALSLLTLTGVVFIYITKLAKHALKFNAPSTDIQARVDAALKPKKHRRRILGDK